MPGPAIYPTINSKNEAIGRDTCRSRGVSIAPRYHKKHLGVSGSGLVMIERELLDKGVNEL